jgi:hypothetical protein
MGTKHKELTALVGTLTTSEKGYLMKFVRAIPVGRRGSSIDLFAHVLRAKGADTDTSALSRQAHRICHYLYHLVLRCLESYHRKKTAIDHILVRCRQAKLLADRGLVGQSKRLAAKAAQHCAAAGLHCLRPVVMHLQRINLLASGKHYGSLAMRQQAYEECTMARTQFHGALALRAHTELAALHLHKGMAQCPAQRAHWQDSYDVYTSEVDARWLNEQGHAHLLMAQALLAHGLGQRDAAIACLHRLVHSMRQTDVPALGPPTLAHASHLLHGLCLHAGRHPEAQQETAAMQVWADDHLPTLIPNERTTVADTLHLQHLALHTHGPAALREPEVYAHAYAHLSGRELPAGMMAQFHTTAMAHHMHSNEPRKAHHHFNALMNHLHARTYHTTLTIGAELMSLSVHHALGNECLLDSTVASLRRRLWVKDDPMPLSGMVRLLARHYAHCPDVHSGKALVLWKQKLHTALIAYRDREPEGYAEAGFDWVGWMAI